jgi:hypothetical protein
MDYRFWYRTLRRALGASTQLSPQKVKTLIICLKKKRLDLHFATWAELAKARNFGSSPPLKSWETSARDHYKANPAQYSKLLGIQGMYRMQLACQVISTDRLRFSLNKVAYHLFQTGALMTCSPLKASTQLHFCTVEESLLSKSVHTEF